MTNTLTLNKLQRDLLNAFLKGNTKRAIRNRKIT